METPSGHWLNISVIFYNGNSTTYCPGKIASRRWCSEGMSNNHRPKQEEHSSLSLCNLVGFVNLDCVMVYKDLSVVLACGL